MAAQAKPKRRIVPVQITSPSVGAAELDDGAANGGAEAGPILVEKQREAAAWAREHLGPDRKVFLDLTDAANKEVDWRKILKERGVQKPNKAAAKPVDDPAASDDPLLLRGRSGRQDNTWTRMLARLEATYCVGGQEESGSESEGGWGDEASDSDAEEERPEGAKPGGSGDDGGAEGGGGDTAEGGEGGKKEGKRGPKKGGGDYDYFDEFIDDEEFLELLEHDKRKPKHTGFFISKGEIERTEEMLPGFQELEGKGKKGGKRKAEEEAGAEGGEPGAAKEAKAGGGEKKKRKQAEGGDGGSSAAEGDKPAKKKKKVVPEAVGAAPAAAAAGAPAAAPAGLSVAQQAKMAGAMAASGAPLPAVPVAPAAVAAAAGSSGVTSPPSGSQAATPSKKRKHYDMPDAVAKAIDAIKEVALRQQPPPAAAEGEKGPRKSLPKALQAPLAALAPLFIREEATAGRTATNRILDALDYFLHPFITKSNLSQRLRTAAKASGQGGAWPPGEKKAKAAAQAMSTEALKHLIGSRVQAKPANSDDDFVSQPPPASTSPPTQAGGAATQPAAGEGGAAAGAAPAKAPPAWKALDKQVQQQVYLFLKERLEGEDIKSANGRRELQEVFNWFPPNSIKVEDLQGLFLTLRNREQAKERKAAEAAAAAAGQAGGQAAQPGAAATPSKQQQQQQSPAAAAGAPAGGQQLSQAEAFAALAVAAAERKVASPPQQQQPAPQRQQQQQPPASPAPAGPGIAAAAVAAAAAAEAAAREAVPAAALTPGTAAPAAAASQAALRAAAAAEAEEAIAAAVLSPGPASQAPAAAAAKPAAAAPEPRPRLYTDDDCVRKALEWGCAEATLRRLLTAYTGQYVNAYLRVLMMVGPGGLTTAEVTRLAAEWGFANLDPASSSHKTAMSRATQKPGIAFIGGNKFALKCIPGVQEVPRPQRAKPSGASANRSNEASPALPEEGEGGAAAQDPAASTA